MKIEGDGREKIFDVRRLPSGWSFTRLAQLALGLTCLGYFYFHPAEWISLPLGLGLTGQAIFRQGCPTASNTCQN